MAIELCLQSFTGFVVLTIGAMAVATGAINHMPLAALGTLIDTSAIMIRAAIDDGIDDLSVVSGYVITETLDIFRAVCLKDCFNRRHGHLLSSGR